MQTISRHIHEVKKHAVELKLLLGATDAGEIKCKECDLFISTQEYSDVVIYQGRIWCCRDCFIRFFECRKIEQGIRLGGKSYVSLNRSTA